MYTKHQELKQASKHAPQPKHESLVATEAIFEFVVAEESISVPSSGIMAGVLLVPEGVLPAVLSPLVAQEADEGRAPDEVGGGCGTEQAVEDREAPHEAHTSGLAHPGVGRRGYSAALDMSCSFFGRKQYGMKAHHLEPNVERCVCRLPGFALAGRSRSAIVRKHAVPLAQEHAD